MHGLGNIWKLIVISKNIPSGIIVYFPRATNNYGWLVCFHIIQTQAVFEDSEEEKESHNKTVWIAYIQV